jgi:hypothetical protein
MRKSATKRTTTAPMVTPHSSGVPTEPDAASGSADCADGRNEVGDMRSPQDAMRS